MTDFNKIESYYEQFDEWARLDNPEGKLEYLTVIDILKQYLPAKTTVLDLGGGPGRYTCALSNEGHRMYLADLSASLIFTAREKIKEFGTPANVISADIINALDLSMYADAMFDAVLLFGPLYHLTSEAEIKTCLSEVSRVLKKGGQIFAIYIPHIAGLTGVMERALYAPAQVDASTLLKTFSDGVFNNRSTEGFQEGAYIKTDKMLEHFSQAGFDELMLRSIRGIGNRREKYILDLQETDTELYCAIMKVISETATEHAVIENCGHAILVGEKR